MKVKATRSFAGLVTMTAGEEKVIDDKYIVDDLLRCGYVTEVEVKPTAKKKAVSADGHKRSDDI